MKSAFSLLIFLASIFNGATALGAPTVSLSPASVQSDANTTITHTISGIAAGETVTVERFADLNNNGAIDFGEPPLRSFVVKDGVRPVIGGIVNGNVPGDDDGVPNGSIRIDLPFPGVDVILNRQPGKYIVRVTGASGQATVPFEITPPNLPQRVTGVLKNSSNNATISFGIIVILVGDGDPVGSVRTDATGAFNFIAPPGDYGLVPISDGYVTSFQFVSIPANQTVTQNLTLAPAPVRLSGKLSDASTGGGLPSVFILAQSGTDQSQIISGALTDLNGNYAFSVTSGAWQVGPLGYFTAQLGYLSDEKSQVVNVASSSVTFNLTAPKATALIYGKITNPSAAVVPSISMRSHVPTGGGLEAQGRSAANGDYFLGLMAGSWDAQTEGATALGFREESKFFTLSDGAATTWDIGLTGFTAHIRGRVVNSSGAGISGVFMEGRYENSQQTSSEAMTGPDGSFDLPVWGGNWSLELNENSGFINHFVHLTVVDGVDQTITFLVPSTTGQISGDVKNSSGQGIANLFVNANATVNGTDYKSSGETDSTGHYQLPVINGSWNISLSCGDLETLNYNCPQSQFATIDNNSATVNFTLVNFVTTASINGRVVDAGGLGISGLQVGAIDQSSGISRSSNSGADGSFSIPVFAGNWNVQIFNPSSSYITPSQQITVTDGVNVNNVQIKLLAIDATITGSLKSSFGAGIAGVRVYANTTVDNITYFAPFSITDASGNFNFAVSRGTWNINLDCDQLSAQNFNCNGGQTANTTSGSTILNITLSPRVSTPLEIQSPTINQSGQVPIFRFTLRGEPGTYDIFGATDVNSPWNQIATTTITFGGNTATPEFNPGANRFFVVKLRQ